MYLLRFVRKVDGRCALVWVAWWAVVVPGTAAPVEPEKPPVAAVENDSDVRETDVPPATIEPDEYLLLPAVGHYGRLPIHQDAVESQIIADEWQPPTAGESIETADSGSKTWRAATAEHGFVDARGFRGGYAYADFQSADERVMLLEAAGHAAVYVNGQPRTGDPYQLGWLKLPVLVRRGQNTLLFHLAAERLSARLVDPPAEVYFLDADHTLPTLVRGEAEVVWGALPIVNATRDWLKNLEIKCEQDGGPAIATPLSPIGPLSVRKVPFQLSGVAVEGDRQVRYSLHLQRSGNPPQAPLATANVTLDVAGQDDVQVRTFLSRIDGSVQPYAVRPALRRRFQPASERSEPAGDDRELSSMIVTFHDAGVDCAAHAALYAAKNWAHVVAPQGRRPYGFDWEEWGRIDALEAIADARVRYPSDPRRTYLTGYGMGGHGAWHLGVTGPGLFAAVGPSAGWASYWSYGGGMPTSVASDGLDALIARVCLPSDTVQVLSNLSDLGVYVLHGDGDEIVPVAQARFMRSRLAAYHTNFAYLERPGVRHAADPECCDWPPMMEFFARLAQPASAEREAIDFTTADPGVTSRYDWLTIEAQQEPYRLSRVSIRQNVDTRTFVGQTTNVARLAIDLGHLPPGQPIDVTLDGQQIERLSAPADRAKLWFERDDAQWHSADPPSFGIKGPERNGTFKSAFDHNVLLVYGTGGTEAEDRWAEAKARYDAETFWYRGGGSPEVMADRDFTLEQTVDRSVILYGNADTNAAWFKLLATCPVQIGRGQIRVGDRTESGDDLAVLVVYPRTDSKLACVGAVAGTGLAGMALTNRIRYFVSGVSYPDFVVVKAPDDESESARILEWRNFTTKWNAHPTEFAWQNAP
jgi:dienelactone hydrolase